MIINLIQTILYVKEQQVSTDFYTALLQRTPDLDVPGMTEFNIGSGAKLGLMPNSGIAKILSGKTPDPALGIGIPRCELYLYVEDVVQAYNNAIQINAKLISPIQNRNWGDRACYFADPDGHIIGFAQRL